MKRGRIGFGFSGRLTVNLALQTEHLDHATWGENYHIATPSASGGGFAVTPDTANDLHILGYGAALAPADDVIVYTWSIEAKANGYDYIFLQHGFSMAGQVFNLNTGAVGSTSFGTVVASGITSLGSGWYRCWVAAHPQNNHTEARIWICNTDSISGYTGDGVSGVLLNKAQYETGSSFTTYVARTT